MYRAVMRACTRSAEIYAYVYMYINIYIYIYIYAHIQKQTHNVYVICTYLQNCPPGTYKDVQDQLGVILPTPCANCPNNSFSPAESSALRYVSFVGFLTLVFHACSSFMHVALLHMYAVYTIDIYVHDCIHLYAYTRM